MSFESEYPKLDFLLGEIFESVGDLKLALKDGHLDVEEIVGAVPDPAVREYLRKLLVALKGLPEEVHTVVAGGPWKMMGVFQALATKVMALFK
jgi:hypothetical protein